MGRPSRRRRLRPQRIDGVRDVREVSGDCVLRGPSAAARSTAGGGARSYGRYGGTWAEWRLPRRMGTFNDVLGFFWDTFNVRADRTLWRHRRSDELWSAAPPTRARCCPPRPTGSIRSSTVWSPPATPTSRSTSSRAATASRASPRLRVEHPHVHAAHHRPRDVLGQQHGGRERQLRPGRAVWRRRPRPGRLRASAHRGARPHRRRPDRRGHASGPAR
jgi:hypothetical protein